MSHVISTNNNYLFFRVFSIKRQMTFQVTLVATVLQNDEFIHHKLLEIEYNL